MSAFRTAADAPSNDFDSTVAAVDAAGLCGDGDDETLSFRITEGRTENHFYRRGPIAAHLLASSGTHPRLLVAFPAGNTGVGLWFARAEQPVELVVEGEVEGVHQPDGMRGVAAVVRASVPALRLANAVLGSVRLLRDYTTFGRLPVEAAHAVESRDGAVVLRRTTFDGRHRVAAVVEPLEGTRARVEPEGALVLEAATGAAVVRARVTALADDSPLTPIAARELLKPGVEADPRELQALAFLCYREKLLAGSWRFLTYFGRDTLLSARLLMPVLRSEVTEAALGSVLERLHEDGDVAHEEDIGEYAALHNLREARAADDPRSPLFDYKMVDDDFLLAPVLAHYLLETAEGRARAAVFLARRTPAGITYAEALRRNLAFVMRRAAPFAAAPSHRTLVALRDEMHVGQWRDSVEGLGMGRIPYDVNAVLVPAALRAAAGRGVGTGGGALPRATARRRGAGSAGGLRARAGARGGRGAGDAGGHAGVPGDRARRRRGAGGGDALGRRLRALVHRARARGAGAGGAAGAAPVPRRAAHARGRGRGEPGLRAGGGDPRALHPRALPRHGGLVVAAGAAGRGDRAAACPVGSSPRDARTTGAGRGRAVAGHRGHQRDA
jgi:hypothetical protein